MTPAVQLAKKTGIAHTVHAYEHDPSVTAYGDEAVDKLGLDPARVFKTLVVATDAGVLAVAVLPVPCKLSFKAVAAALGAKKAAMAEPAAVTRATGYVLGGVSPMGQKKRLPLVIDDSARSLATIFVSAGRRGLEIELAPDDLAALTGGRFAAIAVE
ncbi:aminoacyl-tRNA deacylase [Acidihalobacter aeolianus]|uniref:Cys-tRNA(Pro)/Cys-tRNA(Cys) deacylase n=1 Tax=Acidihalobacter aeolianus TaxID=2792603 RepID=A0A1D8K8J4_9GAMM|nr:Cys-tRNA(Pro) deacylase [Acidihalobacter aeolianus]AOV17283.1 aminoacyl-tRNA deacylase [Acidihalobacter aeolianus]